MRPLASDKVRYILAGGWNTLVGYLIFLVAYLAFGGVWHYLLIAFLSHLAASLNAWLTYRYFVFRSSSQPLAEYLRFSVSAGFVVVLQLALLALLVTVCGFHPLFAQVLTIVSSLMISYVAHKRFSFVP